ncbi:anti-sigma factor [Naasia sp. SYSU D00057]|uniref:anti-sigma factor n=1 Tax=Naasia sp. SYSU D00057 TaxID=2817380 RepID=UPI001B304286|nr:anti-sigma factor [Naasia sp. SYSU D00057]
MPHVDPDVLALLALGEDVASPEERAHVADCAACRAELANLRRTATVGRSALGAGDLLPAPARVWTRIAEELELQDATLPGVPAAAASATPPEAPVASVPAERPAADAAPRQRPTARPRRAWMLALAAVAVVLLVIGGGVTVWQLLRPAPAAVLATAELDPFPGWSGAAGTAELEETRTGARQVQVTLEAPGTDEGYREVWLITSDATELVSLGVLDGTSGTFSVPAGIDTSRYDLVDVSEEPFDGDPTHSGDSIVRGQLQSS